MGLVISLPFNQAAAGDIELFEVIAELGGQILIEVFNDSFKGLNDLLSRTS